MLLGGEFFGIGFKAECNCGAVRLSSAPDALAAQQVEHSKTRKSVVARPGGDIDAARDQVGIDLFRGAHQLHGNGFAGGFYFFVWHVVNNGA